MITLLDIKKFLIWANLGLYHRNKPLHQVEVQNDSPHYKLNDIKEYELTDLILEFNKRVDNEQI
tara:strand:+ start:216 stop:407 length:192 start_codon:yes stop_codon:yes gene_type:complete